MARICSLENSAFSKSNSSFLNYAIFVYGSGSKHMINADSTYSIMTRIAFFEFFYSTSYLMLRYNDTLDMLFRFLLEDGLRLHSTMVLGS